MGAILSSKSSGLSIQIHLFLPPTPQTLTASLQSSCAYSCPSFFGACILWKNRHCHCHCHCRCCCSSCGCHSAHSNFGLWRTLTNGSSDGVWIGTKERGGHQGVVQHWPMPCFCYSNCWPPESWGRIISTCGMAPSATAHSAGTVPNPLIGTRRRPVAPHYLLHYDTTEAQLSSPQMLWNHPQCCGDHPSHPSVYLWHLQVPSPNFLNTSKGLLIPWTVILGTTFRFYS